MNEQDFKTGFPGALVAASAHGMKAFIPDLLPREVAHGQELTKAVAGAQEAVGRLDSALPATNINPYLLVYPLMQREAYYSSLMEGTYTTPTQMALFSEEKRAEGTGTEASEHEQTREVFNYINAMKNGLAMVRKQERSMQHSMILELHKRLMDGVRGGKSRPGQYRTEQNWVGREIDGPAGARFVPPPPMEVRPLMDNLVKYIREHVGRDAPLPYPVGLALVHYQFETIHPFEDGNGRIGRLMIPLLLIEKKIMREPLLHVSRFLERRKEEYKDRLLLVSQRGEWKEWICFFLTAIKESAAEAQAKVSAVLSLRESYIAKVRAPRSSVLVTQLIENLFKRPSITFNEAKDLLGVTHAQAAEHVRRLEKVGILKKAGQARRNMQFVATEIIDTIYE